MKKYLLMIASLLIMGGSSAYAQEIVPNGSFENWTGYDPDGWIALFNNDEFQNIFQSDEAQSGSHSVELRVVYHPLFSNYVRPGVFINPNFEVGSRPGALNGYYKGTSAGGDTLSIAVSMWKEDIMIGFGFFHSTQTVSSWTSFSNPITYITEETPDEGFVSIYAGQAFSSNDGTDYFVDNLTFSGPAGINNMTDQIDFTLFPNPADQEVTISLSLNRNNILDFELITPQGIVIPVSPGIRFQAGSSSHQISTVSFASGIYFLNIRNGDSQAIKKIIINH